jgi:Na+-transporting NADH:ubiquinone oxidoreductase subunit B
MDQTDKKIKLIQKQAIMRRVLLALLPCIIGSVYFFGWRCLFLIILSAAVGYAVEYIFSRRLNKPVSEAVFVTTTLFALIMPPTVGIHVLVIGVVFAVMFAKGVFGGYGKNIFNPAIVGRCFVYVCFPVALTGTWVSPAQGPWGALAEWSTVTSPEAITAATPMAYLKSGRLILDDTSENTIPVDVLEGESKTISRKTLFNGLMFGRISGTLGVTSSLLILIGGIYLFYTKTASRATIISVILTYAVSSELLHRLGVEPVTSAWVGLLSGGFLLGAFFMATDPVSSPRTNEGRIFYGIIIGICALVIRNFSIFNGGLMFSILIGNMFAPTIDYAVKAVKNRGQEKS